MKGYIRITLKSDLCAASGDGFSLSIDTDVCSDRYGLPFIPSRRLKGCLREAAEYIGCDHTDCIFGIAGNDNSGSLRINDARLKNYSSLVSQAENSKYSAEQVLSLFTSVKASTAIENDTAKENSLRFTRVVNHYSPFDKSELVFVSEVEYAEGDAEHLGMICKALRNIGYKRTRGYGSVKCEFVPDGGSKSLVVDIPDDENEYDLRLTVKLCAPAMFAGKSSVETLDYIPGSAVLGAFAAGYADKNGTSFDELFLKKKLRFSDMYITDGKTVSEPAPAVLGKTKDSSDICFIFRGDAPKDKIVKPFKGGWLVGKEILKPEKETIYHHRTEKKEADQKALLYTQECLCEGQLFSGRITGTGKALRELLTTLESGRLNLGRSKSAQYSACEIVSADCVQINTETVPAGEVYALLCSDVLLLDENGQFSTDINELAKSLGAKLTDEDKAHSSLRYRTVMGYISVGRYKRSHIRAFEKGSVIRFTADKSLSRYLTVGERQNEGFGVIKLCKKDEMMKLGRPAPKQSRNEISAEGKLTELVGKNNVLEELRISALDYAEERYESVKNTFNASFVGRLLLMVGQAKDEADLNDRVASVKDEKKRDAAQKFIEDAKAKPLYGNDWKKFLQLSLTVIKYKTKEAGK